MTEYTLGKIELAPELASRPSPRAPATGWYCPRCAAHHGPHIDTCPAADAGRQDQTGITVDIVGDGRGKLKGA